MLSSEPNLSEIIRFLKKVNDTGNCWEWNGFIDKVGYGQFWFQRRTWLPHRFSYELFKGKIPQGLTIDHLCKNPSCVNPEHLEAVTMKENLLRGNTFQAKNSQKTTCPQGHLYSKENTYIHRNKRYCRICIRVNQANYALRKKQK